MRDLDVKRHRGFAFSADYRVKFFPSVCDRRGAVYFCRLAFGQGSAFRHGTVEAEIKKYKA